jgi:hypothetical protein
MVIIPNPFRKLVPKKRRGDCTTLSTVRKLRKRRHEVSKASRHAHAEKCTLPEAKSAGPVRRAKQHRHGVSKLPGYVYAQKGTRAEIKARACAYCGPKHYRTDQFVVDNLLPEFTGSQKLCFDVIVRHSTGCSQPSAHLSLNDFANITGRTKGTVIRALRSLDDAGLIERIAHQAPDGSRAKTEYRVTIPALETDPGSEPGEEKTRRGSQVRAAEAGELDIAPKSESGYSGHRVVGAIAANAPSSQSGEARELDSVLKSEPAVTDPGSSAATAAEASCSQRIDDTCRRAAHSATSIPLASHPSQDRPRANSAFVCDPLDDQLPSKAEIRPDTGRVKMLGPGGGVTDAPSPRTAATPQGGDYTTPPYKEEKVTEKGNRAKGNQDHDDYREALHLSSSSPCSSSPTTIALQHDFIREALGQDGVAGILLSPASNARLSRMAQSIRTGVFDSSGLDPDSFVEWMARAAEITAAKQDVRNVWPFFEGVLRNQVAEKTADTPPSTHTGSEQPPHDDDPQGYFTSKYQHLYQ